MESPTSGVGNVGGMGGLIFGGEPSPPMNGAVGNIENNESYKSPNPNNPFRVS